MMDESIAAGEKKSEWETHDFDVGGVVIDGGPMELEIEGEGTWTVAKGDSFYVKAGSRHRGINRGSKPMQLITVADPPRY